MADGYEHWRGVHSDISGSVSIDATTTSETPIAARALETIFVQRLTVDIVSPGAQGSTWTVTDTNGIVLTADFPADAAGSVVRDFTAKGRALGEGEGLVIDCDAGAEGIVTWEGYRKRTGVGAA